MNSYCWNINEASRGVILTNKIKFLNPAKSTLVVKWIAYFLLGRFNLEANQLYFSEHNIKTTVPYLVKICFLAMCLFVVVILVLLWFRFVRRHEDKNTRFAPKYCKGRNKQRPIGSYNQTENQNFVEVLKKYLFD